MQPANQPKRPSGGPSQSSPPRTKPYGLASIAVQSFAAFRSQTKPPPAPSPVRRKPLPPGSPVVERYSSAEFSSRSRGADDSDNRQRSFSTNSPRSNGPRRLDPVLSPALSDEEVFVPRNLDESPHGQTPVTSTLPTKPHPYRESPAASTTPGRPNPLLSTASNDTFAPREKFGTSIAPDPIFPERRSSVAPTVPDHTFTPRTSSVTPVTPDNYFPPRKSSLSTFRPVGPTNSNIYEPTAPASRDSAYEPRVPSNKDSRSPVAHTVPSASNSRLPSQPTFPTSNDSRPFIERVVPNSNHPRPIDTVEASSSDPTVHPIAKDQLSSFEPTVPRNSSSGSSSKLHNLFSRKPKHPSVPSTKTSDPTAPSKASLATSNPVVPTSTGPLPRHNHSASGSQPPHLSTEDRATDPTHKAFKVGKVWSRPKHIRSLSSFEPEQQPTHKASESTDHSTPRQSHPIGNPQPQPHSGADPKVGTTEPSGPSSSTPVDDQEVTFPIGQQQPGADISGTSTHDSSRPSSPTALVDDPRVSFDAGEVPHTAEDSKTSESESLNNLEPTATVDDPEVLSHTGQHSPVESDLKSSPRQSFESSRSAALDDPEVTSHIDEHPSVEDIPKSFRSHSFESSTSDDPKVTFHTGPPPSVKEHSEPSPNRSFESLRSAPSVEDPNAPTEHPSVEDHSEPSQEQSFESPRSAPSAEDLNATSPTRQHPSIEDHSEPSPNRSFESSPSAEDPNATFPTEQHPTVGDHSEPSQNQSFESPRSAPSAEDPNATSPTEQHPSVEDHSEPSQEQSFESPLSALSVEDPKATFPVEQYPSIEDDSEPSPNRSFESPRSAPPVEDPNATFSTGQPQSVEDHPKPSPNQPSFESSRSSPPVDDPKGTFYTGQHQSIADEPNTSKRSLEPSRPTTPLDDPKVTFHIRQPPSNAEELKASVTKLSKHSSSSGSTDDHSDHLSQPQQLPRTKELKTASDKPSKVGKVWSRPKHIRSLSSFEQQPRARELRTPANKAAHARSPTMPNMPLYASEPRPTNLKLRLDGVRLDGVTEDFIDEDPYDDAPDSAHETKPKSPAAGKFTSFFGWNSSKAQNGAESPTTTFSEKSLSPAVSPRFPKPPSHMPAKMKPTGLEGLNIPVANSFGSSSYFNVPGTPLLSSSPQMNAHVEELERELREVSSELAASIRREMELEDEVERYKMESTTVMSDNRRTSDYYSDSGASSVRYPIGDSESKLEEVETLRRKAEQERAQLKVRMAERTQEELRRRRDLEEQVQQLEEQVSVPRAASVADTGRLQELENSLEDAKRRLAEERQVKENFEDLLTALRDELEKHRNERDNLRDEVVPQLRARLEGLESEATDTQTLIYESTRMQQEIQQLRSENQTLTNARRMQQEIQQQQTRFQSIAEEADAAPPATKKMGLSRSNSLARSSNTFNRLSRSNSLARSNSVKDRTMPESPREGPLAGNPVKELEEQRDALHKALKHLLQRQELQQREFQRRIKELEVERDNALNLTPRRTTFHKEVAHLRDEVNSLRRRADDALEQKWQCEKGLGGLRMDLDRAQQETSSLRELLQEHDISIPEIRVENEPLPLDKAYDELRTTHALSLARIKQIENDDTLGEAGAEAERTLDLLKRSISDAEAEREAAQKEAEQYRQQARELQKSEIEHLGKEQKLGNDLYVAATRMDDLSNRIQIQLKSNKSLRDRLTDAISRGEKEQEKSTEKIIELERRLKSAEDKVVLAQQSSEEAVSRHEEEVQTLKESHNTHLRRVKSGLLSPIAFSPKIPPSPVFAQRSPRLEITTSGPAMSIAEATRTELLEQRVEELEKALRDADHEMEEVVGRMNMAQMEVADLQYERDEAMRQTRKLQADIQSEREKVKVLMAKT